MLFSRRRFLQVILAPLCAALCAAPFSGCQRGEETSSSAGKSESESAPPQAASPSSISSSSDNAAKPDEDRLDVFYEGGPRDGEQIPASMILTLSEEPLRVQLRLPSSRSVNWVGLLPNGFNAPATGQVAARVEVGDTLLYASSDQAPAGTGDALNLPDSRLLRFDTVQTDTLSVTLWAPAGSATVEGFAWGCLAGDVVANAYLPVATPPNALDDYAQSLSRLDTLTVISGLCWDAQGNVQILSDNDAPLNEALRARRETDGFRLYATVYPQAQLGRQGTAGQTLDTPQKRTALAQALLSHAQQYALDGMDLDWETLASPDDWMFYADFIAELSALLEADGKALSVALYPEEALLLRPDAAKTVTLNLMTYDQFDAAGRHATFSVTADAARKAQDHGYRQIYLGIPSYGRPLDGAAQWPLYKDQSVTPTDCLLNGAWLNSPLLVRDKAALAQLYGLDGVFLYHLTGDFPIENPLSLLGAID